MTDNPVVPQIDQEKLTKEITEKVKADAIKAAQDALVSKLTGDKPQFSWEEQGKDAPSTYGELFEEIKKKTPALSQEEIDARVEAKIKERDEANQRAQEEKVKSEAKTIEERRKQLDVEWYQLQNEGKLPKVREDLQEKINKGESLTKEEFESDEALKARRDLIELAVSSGKSLKLAFYEDYGKQPAGAKAPVLGGRPSAPQSEDKEPTYDEIKAERKKIFGY